jgi:hypothetical protein
MGEAMFSFDGLNQVIGTDDMLAQGYTYNPEAN